MITYDEYLAHYGVKGMKWGVRHDKTLSGVKRSVSKKVGKAKYQNPDGSLTREGRKKYHNRTNFEARYKYDRAAKIFLASAAITAAAVIGFEAYKHGRIWTDKELPAGTLVQNIAPQSRTFDTSFYGVHDQKSQQFFIKNFVKGPTWFNPEGRNKITLLKNEEPAKIAGRKAMDKAYKEVIGPASLSEKTNYWHRFGGLTEEERRPIIDNLTAKGYKGMKDVNDMLIGWGDTPTIHFGKDSGFVPIKSATANIAKSRNLKRTSKTVGESIQLGQFVVGTAAYGSILGALGAKAASDRSSDKTWSYKMYHKPYKDLSPKQKLTYSQNVKAYKKYRRLWNDLSYMEKATL